MLLMTPYWHMMLTFLMTTYLILDRLDEYKKDDLHNTFGCLDSVLEEIINNQKTSDVPIRTGKHSTDRNLRDSASLLYFPFQFFEVRYA